MIGRGGLLTQASDRASAGMEGSALLCRSRPWSNSLLITMVAGWRRNCAVLISRGGMIDALCFMYCVRAAAAVRSKRGEGACVVEVEC